MICLTVSSTEFVPNYNSILLTDKNFLELQDGNYHTSLGDISVNNFLTLCSNVDSIEFLDFDDSPLRIKTVTVLNQISKKKKVENFVQLPALDFLDIPVPRSADSMLWVFGCSFSHGVGVSCQEKYPSILQDLVNKESLFVTKPATSTRWSLRHLINANLKETDIVIWQITTMARLSIAASPTSLNECSLKDAPKEIVIGLTESQMFADQLSLLNYGVQYLRSKKVKFFVISIEGQNKFTDNLVLEYSKYHEYLYMGEWVIDKGSDGLHPGKLSHEFVAKTIHNNL
jgi:hypothetical protein